MRNNYKLILRNGSKETEILSSTKRGDKDKISDLIMLIKHITLNNLNNIPENLLYLYRNIDADVVDDILEAIKESPEGIPDVALREDGKTVLTLDSYITDNFVNGKEIVSGNSAPKNMLKLIKKINSDNTIFNEIDQFEINVIRKLKNVKESISIINRFDDGDIDIDGFTYASAIFIVCSFTQYSYKPNNIEYHRWKREKEGFAIYELLEMSNDNLEEIIKSLTNITNLEEMLPT